MTKEIIIKELRAILKTHYYDVKGVKRPLNKKTLTNFMGREVAIKLENVLGLLLKDQLTPSDNRQLEFPFPEQSQLNN